MAQDEVEFVGAGQPGAKQGGGSKMRNFCRMIYNPEEKAFIGRTASSWAKIGLFYMIFYSCLAGFFAVMLVGFFSTLDDTAPTQQQMYSLIKANPGMGFRPMPNVESTLIKINAGVPKSYEEHIKSIKKLLEPYKEQNQTNLVNCTETDPDPEPGEACRFTLEQLGDNCTEANDFGYKDGKPCVLLKINRVFKWTPHPFTNDTLDNKENHIAQDAKRLLGDRLRQDYIGISCEGENEGDADNLGDVLYYPKFGFSYKYYPYMNQKDYQSPLVFVQFPNVNKGAVIQVWCKIWTNNIKHHKNDKAGSTHFELLVDQKPADNTK